MYSKIADNIYCIHVDMPRSPLKNLNAYYIKGEDRSLLVDTGDRKPESIRSFFEGIEELGVDLDRTDVFLTHLHHDHTGVVPRIYRDGMKVYLSHGDIAANERLYINDNPKDRIRRRTLMGFSRDEIDNTEEYELKNYYIDDFKDFCPVNDGDVLRYGGRELKVVLTPGHTPGHACLYDEENRIFFSGDHVLFGITPNITFWGEDIDSLGNYIYSLLKVRDLPVDMILPAHRQVTGTLAQRADEIIEHHGERVKETADILDKYPGSTTCQLASHMHWNLRYDGTWENFPPIQKPFATNEVHAHMQYLVRRGRAREEIRNGVKYFYPPEKCE